MIWHGGSGTSIRVHTVLGKVEPGSTGTTVPKFMAPAGLVWLDSGASNLSCSGCQFSKASLLILGYASNPVLFNTKHEEVVAVTEMLACESKEDLDWAKVMDMKPPGMNSLSLILSSN